MSSKACFKCGVVKPLTEFYRHGRMSDCTLNKCKECTKLDVAKHRLANIEKIREYDRLRGRQEHRLKMRQMLVNKRAEAYPHRNKANSVTSNAIRDGRLVPLPCWVCGEERVEAHHADYDRPLQVVWLCVRHHRQLHSHARLWEQGREPVVIEELTP